MKSSWGNHCQTWYQILNWSWYSFWPYFSSSSSCLLFLFFLSSCDRPLQTNLSPSLAPTSSPMFPSYSISMNWIMKHDVNSSLLTVVHIVFIATSTALPNLRIQPMPIGTTSKTWSNLGCMVLWHNPFSLWSSNLSLLPILSGPILNLYSGTTNTHESLN